MASRNVIGGQDEAVAEWVSARIPNFDMGDSPYTAIGQSNGVGHLIGGVIFNNYIKDRDIHLHVAGDGNWLTRKFLGEVFRYVFVQLGCQRCTAMVPASNKRALRFDERIGFKYEGTLRQALALDEDCIVLGMLKRECRWLQAGLSYGRISQSHRTTIATLRRAYGAE